jgi:hypothetical protein
VTALAGRRRRATLVVGVATITVFGIAAALTVLGAVTLYNSTEGASPSTATDELAFPDTPTGAFAALDEDGNLASLAVLVVQPAGQGGSIVAIPVSADASAGVGDERLPLAETVALQGTDVLARELEVTLRLGLDHVEVVDAERLDDLLAPLGDLEVDLPDDVTDADGDEVAEEGQATIDAATAAAILTARDPDIPAIEQYPAAAAVWSAVAAAAGDGITVDGGPPTTVAAGDTVDDADELFARLLAGPVGYRSVRTIEVPVDDNPRSVDVVMLDTAELLLVFGQIAPGAVAAPNPGLTFRVVSAFSDGQLAASGLTNTEVAFGAISSLLFIGGNVRSVSTTADAETRVGETTTIEVADETLVTGAETSEVLFGAVDVVVAERPITGVDAVVTLGEAYLELLQSGPPPTPSTPPTTPGTREGGSTPTTEEDDD